MFVDKGSSQCGIGVIASGLEAWHACWNSFWTDFDSEIIKTKRKSQFFFLGEVFYDDVAPLSFSKPATRLSGVKY